ncbi:MAG: indole-3-glycerol-phosphate synthase TrpC, partial [Planctomycetota bacterium]
MAPDALQKIVTRKRREVAERKAQTSLESLQSRVASMPAPRNFFQAVVAQGSPRQSRVIAEVKRKSPSAGLIRVDFDPVDIARRYHEAGAAA